MTRNYEGTVQLDGLIEGRIPPDAESIEQRLREWVEFAKQANLRFSLDIDGAGFSLLPDTSPIPADDLGPDPSETIRDLLDQLLSVFTPPQRTSVFSTLRSSEFQPGKEIQTIYAIGSDGRIDVQQRTVEAETTKPAEPLTLARKIRLAGLGLAIAAVLLAISSIWVPYGRLISEAVHRAQPVDADKIALDLGHFEPYLEPNDMSTRRVDKHLLLVISIRRTEAFPTDAAELQAAWEAAGDDLHKRLTIEALARGQLSVEQFDAEGKYRGRFPVRIAGLREKQTVSLDIPIRRKYRPERVVLVY